MLWGQEEIVALEKEIAARYRTLEEEVVRDCSTLDEELKEKEYLDNNLLMFAGEIWVAWRNKNYLFG